MRLLLIRPGAIGDFIVSLPALEFLSKSAGYAELWAPTPQLSLVRFANRVRGIASTGLDLLELGQAPESLHTALAGFDQIWSWYGYGRPAFEQATAHLPIRGFPALPSDDTNIAATDFYLRQVGAPLGATPRIACPPRDGGYAVIHPFSGSPGKNWPLAQFQALASELAKRMPVTWCAGPSEVLDEAHRFEDLFELACWLSAARLYVGNDSGITHLAAAVGVPVLALFGPTRPEVWAPRGNHVRVLKHDPIVELPLEAVVKCIPCG